MRKYRNDSRSLTNKSRSILKNSRNETLRSSIDSSSKSYLKSKNVSRESYLINRRKSNVDKFWKRWRKKSLWRNKPWMQSYVKLRNTYKKYELSRRRRDELSWRWKLSDYKRNRKRHVDLRRKRSMNVYWKWRKSRKKLRNRDKSSKNDLKSETRRTWSRKVLKCTKTRLMTF